MCSNRLAESRPRPVEENDWLAFPALLVVEVSTVTQDDRWRIHLSPSRKPRRKRRGGMRHGAIQLLSVAGANPQPQGLGCLSMYYWVTRAVPASADAVSLNHTRPVPRRMMPEVRAAPRNRATMTCRAMGVPVTAPQGTPGQGRDPAARGSERNALKPPSTAGRGSHCVGSPAVYGGRGCHCNHCWVILELCLEDQTGRCLSRTAEAREPASVTTSRVCFSPACAPSP